MEIFMIEELWMLFDIAISALLGFAIGLERKIRMKEAGIRTHTIVCVGSALMMIISMHAFGPNSDTARVAAQIVTGIGFLGAGIIVFKKHEVRGLTTAAGIWATAGVGMAAGASMYILAVGSTLILILSQCIFRLKIFKSKKTFSVNIRFIQENGANMKIKQIFGVDRFNHLIIERKGDMIIYSATLNTEKELSSNKLNEIITSNTFIYSIERCDND
ncbi:MAG: MgtC/SapB family protein [Clostridia bacterium]|nr:MgtC/SapB family protein [Clostridia bacterium]